MEKGIIYYDEHGRPICNICGRSFKKLISHVIQTHSMTGLQYKDLFGYDRYKSIMSKDSRYLARMNAIKNYPKIKDNLLVSGRSTRFKIGHSGRTKDKISPQTERRLKNSKFKTKSNGN